MADADVADVRRLHGRSEVLNAAPVAPRIIKIGPGEGRESHSAVDRLGRLLTAKSQKCSAVKIGCDAAPHRGRRPERLTVC